MGTNAKLDLDKVSPSINQTVYKGIIDSLLYLTASYPDIVFSVGICALFQVDLKELT